MTLIAGDTWNILCKCLLEAAYIQIQTVILEMIKHTINVSKSNALHLNFMHIKASTAMEKHTTPSEDDIYTVPARFNYIVRKGFHHNNLLSFMQKTVWLRI